MLAEMKLTETPSLCSRIVEYWLFRSLCKQDVLGVPVLIPSPMHATVLGAASTSSDTTVPPEISTASLYMWTWCHITQQAPCAQRASGMLWRHRSVLGCKWARCPEAPGSAYAAWNMPLDFHPGNAGQKYGVTAFWMQLMALRLALWVLLWVLIHVIWISNAGEKGWGTPKRFVGVWVVFGFWGVFFGLFFGGWLVFLEGCCFVCFQMC